MLTNKEVEIMFRRIIQEWFNDMDTGYGDFRRALLHDNIEEMNYYMNMVTLSTFSYFDTGTGRGNIDETERFYHGFVLGLLADLSDQFSIRSNRRVVWEDMTLFSARGKKTAILTLWNLRFLTGRETRI